MPRTVQWVLTGLLATIACGTAAAEREPALDAEAIIAHHVAARGGAAALGAIGSLRREGVLRLPDGAIELAVVELRARPGRLRQDATLQGLTAVSAWDGAAGWQVQPFGGRKDPERLSDDEAKPLIVTADLDTPLVDYRAKGASVAYLGTEDVEGAPAHKLRLRLRSGDEITYFIDPDSWMIIRDVLKYTVRGAERQLETDYGEYEQVSGVYVPMSEASGDPGSEAAQKQQITWSRAAANIAADAAAFAMPVTK